MTGDGLIYRAACIDNRHNCLYNHGQLNRKKMTNKPNLTDAQLKLRGLHSEGFQVVSCELEKEGRRCCVDSNGMVVWDSDIDSPSNSPSSSLSSFEVIGISCIAILALALFYVANLVNQERDEIGKISAEIRENLISITNGRMSYLVSKGFDACKKVVSDDVREFVLKKQKPVEGSTGRFYIGSKAAEQAEDMLNKGISTCQQIFFEQVKLL